MKKSDYLEVVENVQTRTPLIKHNCSLLNQIRRLTYLSNAYTMLLGLTEQGKSTWDEGELEIEVEGLRTRKGTDLLQGQGRTLQVVEAGELSLKVRIILMQICKSPHSIRISKFDNLCISSLNIRQQGKIVWKM